MIRCELQMLKVCGRKLIPLYTPIKHDASPFASCNRSAELPTALRPHSNWKH